MSLIGRVVRWLLNINTIWGLMILIAFGACAAQQFLPCRTVIPVAALHAGENALQLRITAANQPPRDFAFTLALQRDGTPRLDTRDAKPITTPAPEDAGAAAGGTRTHSGDGAAAAAAGREAEWPRLLGVRRVGAGLVLTWDCAAHGRYELAAAGQVVARGRLVTLQTLTDAAFDYAKTAFDIALGLVAVMVLFLGLMRVGQDAGLVQLVARGLHPLIRLLFPGVPREHPASAALLMNITTTLLGLANAATPFGLKAMEELQKLNPRKKIASNAQVMLLGINTAGFALLPTTLLALRKSAGCAQPFEIIGTCMVAGAAATLTAILAVRVLGWLPMFSVETAAAEEAGEAAATPAAKGAD